jgi:hypothetical protein
MKTLFVLLFSLCSVTTLFAQKGRDIYTDVSLPLGLSATYDFRVARHFEVGGGIQAFNNRRKYKNITSSIFLDLRPYWQKKKNLFFILADFGITTYLGETPDPAKYEVAPFGAYSALGFGYCRTITKRGMGPYISFALRGASYQEHYSVASSPAAADYTVIDATGLLSVGFKF